MSVVRVKSEPLSDDEEGDKWGYDDDEVQVLPTPTRKDKIILDLDDLDENENVNSLEPPNKRQKVGGGESDLENQRPGTSTTTTSNYNTQNQEYKVTVYDDGDIYVSCQNQQHLNKMIQSLAKLSHQEMSKVKRMSIISLPEDNLYLKAKQVLKLSSMVLPQLSSLYIQANLYENVTSKMIEDLLLKFATTLTCFTITGGFVGIRKNHFILRVPPLPQLELFALQSQYNFDISLEIDKSLPSNTNHANSNGEIEVIDIQDIDDDDNEVPTTTGTVPAEVNELFRITVYLPKLKNLTKLELGHYVNVISTDIHTSTQPEFYFDYFEALDCFKVGSPWQSNVNFIPDEFKKPQRESRLKSLQFPDGLQDPSIIRKVAKQFPQLEKVYLNLPSPAVLQEFLQIFSKFPILKLYLQTNYVFEGTLEKILCGSAYINDEIEEAKITWIQNHGDLVGFQDEEIVNTITPRGSRGRKRVKFAGVGKLKNLTSLRINHVPRKIAFTRHGDLTLGFDKYSAFPLEPQPFIEQLKKIKGLEYFRFPKKVHEDLLKYIKGIGLGHRLRHVSSKSKSNQNNYNYNYNLDQNDGDKRLKVNLKETESSNAIIKAEFKKEKL